MSKILSAGKFVILLLIYFHTQANLNAESKTLSVDQLRAHALLHSPEVQRLDSLASIKLAEALQIKTLLNPSLQTQANIPYSYTGNKPKTTLQLTLSQPLRLSDFDLRGRISSLIQESSALDQNFELQKFLQSVTLLFCRLWALQLEEQHLQERTRQAQSLVKILQSGSFAGTVSPAQQKKASAALALSEAEMLGVQHAKLQVSSEILRSTNFDPRDFKLLKPELSTIPEFENFASSLQADQKSLLGRMKARMKLASEQERLARRDSYPEFTPQLTYSRNEDGNDFAGFGFSVPLPFFDSNQAEIKKQQAVRKQQKSQLDYIQSEHFERELRILYESVQIKLKQAQAYEQRVIPMLRESLQLSRKALDIGQGSPLDVWTAQLEFHEALDRSTELWIEAFSGFTELSILCGQFLL